jgi:N-acylglucosamine 2-epimerase
MDKGNGIRERARLYRKTLIYDVVPFWLKYGVDMEHGGLKNCLDDDGNLLSTDKFIWSQGRGLWTFSALYNRIEPKEEWLNVAHHIYRYLQNHGRDERGYWAYLLDAEGNIKEKDISIYVDGFVMNGLGEYYKATGDENAAQLALETFKNILDRLQRPGSYGIAPYKIPEGMKTHGIAMIFSFFFYQLGKALGRPDICEIGYQYAKEILNDFYIPEKDAVLEFVTLDGKYVDSPEGRTCVPGHVLEGMWFLITIFEDRGEKDSIAKCCRLIKRHLELAWDHEYGGLLLGLDIDGKEPVFWQKADYKPWWVQIEALVATSYAYLHTGEDWCLEWHDKVREYAYQHYPVAGGEWTQWLDRYGRKAESAALPVKDPFHLPRGLMYLIDLWGNRITI